MKFHSEFVQTVFGFETAVIKSAENIDVLG